MFCVCLPTAPEQDVQHRRAPGAHELLQHGWRHQEDPAEVHTPPGQDTHLQPEQVRAHVEDTWRERHSHVGQDTKADEKKLVGRKSKEEEEDDVD